MLTLTVNEEEQAVSVRDFILKLSGAPNLFQDDSVLAIKEQLRLLEQNRYFVEVFDSLHPDRFYSETRSLSDSQKQTLSRALMEYAQNHDNSK